MLRSFSPPTSFFLLFRSSFLISFPLVYRVTIPVPPARYHCRRCSRNGAFFGSRRKKWLVNYIIVIVKAEGVHNAQPQEEVWAFGGRAGMHIIKTFRTVLSLVVAPTHRASTVSMVSGSLELLSSSRAPPVYTLIGDKLLVPKMRFIPEQ